LRGTLIARHCGFEFCSRLGASSFVRQVEFDAIEDGAQGILVDDAGKPIDFIILTELLRDRQRLDQVGGAAYVTELFTFLPTSANVGYYLEIVQEKHTLREIIKVCTEYAARSYDEQDNVPNLLDDVEGKIFAIAQDRFKDKTASMKEQVMQAIHDIEVVCEVRLRCASLGLTIAHDEVVAFLADEPNFFQNGKTSDAVISLHAEGLGHVKDSLRR
jgi:replicative DNA helicase